jgi:hypothetical protein
MHRTHRLAPCHLPNVGCVLGKCVFECDEGFADDNDDLGEVGGDGCESDCVPSNGGVGFCLQ